MFNRRGVPNCVTRLIEIDVEDLEYVERDLCFSELVSLGFLLFGEERANAGFVLQKLLVLAANTASGAPPADLLRKYASVDPSNWRAKLVEALAIIGARRVLRKLGFQWEELRQHYLPHIAELSLHVHPLLKALYKMCERLTPVQAGRLVLQINEEHKKPEEHLRFYDSAFAEIFLLDWITHRIIDVGDREANGANVQVLLSYFKLNEMDGLKTLLVETINSNAARPTAVPAERRTESNGHCSELAPPANNTSHDSSFETPPAEKTTSSSQQAQQQPEQPALVSGASGRTCEISQSECYVVRQTQAGIVLIINQRNFYEETAEELLHLLPRKRLRERCGTDVDKHKVTKVFSSFGYTPVVYENLTHIELLHNIRETVKRSFLFDSLIVFILSHGIDGAVYGNNSIPVDIADIEQIINAGTLQDKPKMMIIQACQKDDAPTSITEKKKLVPAASALAANAYADMIKAMSTVPGFPSMRHTATGTWFIQSLCDAVHNLGDKKHMLDILIAVTRDVSNKRGDKNELMVPLTCNTTGKYFFLPRREAL